MMRRLLAPSALILFGLSLAGCNTGAPQGVLPRTEVPPPPSLTGGDSRGRGAKAAQQSGPVAQRPAVSVPDTMSTPRPSSTTVEPVMTGSGVGAGFKF
ncbi:MAG: hypothetical protein K0S56_2575 [Microvirga sp.]|jgi:hypothetical protein|nr:hypothetical protein [Microvirga sp.]